MPQSTPVQREAQRRILTEAERLARRLGLSRRQFLSSICGSALALTTLAACSKEEQAVREPGTEPGGTFTVPPSSTTEPEAALEALSGPAPIIDVQTHLLEFDPRIRAIRELCRDDPNDPGFRRVPDRARVNTFLL